MCFFPFHLLLTAAAGVISCGSTAAMLSRFLRTSLKLWLACVIFWWATCNIAWATDSPISCILLTSWAYHQLHSLMLLLFSKNRIGFLLLHVVLCLGPPIYHSFALLLFLLCFFFIFLSILNSLFFCCLILLCFQFSFFLLQELLYTLYAQNEFCVSCHWLIQCCWQISQYVSFHPRWLRYIQFYCFIIYILLYIHWLSVFIVMFVLFYIQLFSLQVWLNFQFSSVQFR